MNNAFNSYSVGDLSRGDLHHLIIGCINPRPIAFVSTLSSNGVHNLAPYSFFNAISSNPPMLCFSVNNPSDGRQHKDTLVNIKQTKECVINLVNYNILRQMTLCSIEFDHLTSEFDKSGLHYSKSDLVQPRRVSQSPVQFECTVENIFDFGKHAGASNLIVCNILKIHINKEVMLENKLRIDSQKLDIMGRLGRSEYVRVMGDNVFEVYQPTDKPCIGFDGLPLGLINSSILTGNELAELAAQTALPSRAEIMTYAENNPGLLDMTRANIHIVVRTLLDGGQSWEALVCALVPETI